MILRIKELAIIEDTGTDVAVNLIPVTDGVDNAAVFGIGNEHNSLGVANGQAYLSDGSPSLEISVLKPSSSDVTQIESWSDNQTDVYVAAVTVDGGFFFGDKQTTTGAIKMTTNEALTDNDLYTVNISRRTTPGFDPSTGLYQGGFWAGDNLIGGYQWGDKDSSGIADGWSAAGFTTTTFASGAQTLEADTSQRDFERSIYFPFEGQQLTFAINNDSRTGSYATEQIEIEFLDSSDSVISSQTSTFSSTGRKSVTGTVPANTYQVVCRFSIQASSGTVTNDVSDPSLRTGTETTYTTF